MIMSLLLFLALILSFTTYSSGQYCLCKQGGQTADPYKKVIDYACGNGANCDPIQQNGPCYQPNNIQGICSYAANSYFQNKKSLGSTCDFFGVAFLSPTLPTDLPSGCTYPPSSGPTTPSPGGNIGVDTGPPGSSSPGNMFSPIGLGPTAGNNGDISANDASSLVQFSSHIGSLCVTFLLAFLILWA